MKILFLSFACQDISVAMVTNMISQLQESFPLRRLYFSVTTLHPSFITFFVPGCTRGENSQNHSNCHAEATTLTPGK